MPGRFIGGDSDFSTAHVTLELPRYHVVSDVGGVASVCAWQDESPETTIGKNVKVKGELAFEKLLRVDGSFEGRLLSKVRCSSLEWKDPVWWADGRTSPPMYMRIITSTTALLTAAAHV